MDHAQTDQLVQQLAAGFDTLQEEYQKLFGQQQALERKLATAREQYNELAKLCGSGDVATPPLSLASSPKQRQLEAATTQTAADLLEQKADSVSKDAATIVRAASKAAVTLRQGLPRPIDPAPSGVKIWSGPSANRPEASSSMMPSISEAPLEQDFTIEGVPSKLGCPFASMAKKKLSSHAASVLSRYDPGSSRAAASTATSRVNGRESFARRRTSFVDPIKAEICGLSDHQQDDQESPLSERAAKEHLIQQESAAEAGVCPIRFLDQHSPEEVATYFERHKHELPRSHEVCVKRYQSNEKQIRQLDAKYGNLVSMIQGLGAKHQDLLPKEPEQGEDVGEEGQNDGEKADKVRQWASSVDAQGGQEGEDGEERQPHFERPLREVRVGESPSRPWGISVPAKYVEQALSEGSSRPAKVKAQALNDNDPKAKDTTEGGKDGNPAGKCPFGFDRAEATSPKEGVDTLATAAKSSPAFIAPDPKFGHDQRHSHEPPVDKQDCPRMVFTGPVFIGYSPEDAARMLKQSGLGAPP